MAVGNKIGAPASGRKPRKIGFSRSTLFEGVTSAPFFKAPARLAASLTQHKTSAANSNSPATDSNVSPPVQTYQSCP